MIRFHAARSVPANLSSDEGDTLVMLAGYHGHPQTVAALA